LRLNRVIPDDKVDESAWIVFRFDVAYRIGVRSKLRSVHICTRLRRCFSLDSNGRVGVVEAILLLSLEEEEYYLLATVHQYIYDSATNRIDGIDNRSFFDY
jgi:hypothetical protein